MKPLSIDYIAEGTEGKLLSRAEGGKYDFADNVAIDSRDAAENGLFFAIIGARTDAHVYLNDVVSRGCHTVVVSDEDWAEKMVARGDVNTILVDDTTKAIMRLARRYMDDWPELRRVAVTGSVGKTSTKEFVYSVLSSKFRTGKTPGNLNSEYGIPLTIFRLDPQTEMAVIEIGLGHGAPMEELVDMVKPEAAVVTTIGSAHMEVFGSRENLAKAKLAVTTGFKGNGGKLIVNADNPMLDPQWIRKNTEGNFKIVTIGTGIHWNYRISNICDEGIDGVKCTLEFSDQNNLEKKQETLSIPVIGSHNLWNASLAIALGAELGIDVHDGIEAVRNVELNANRLDVTRTAKYTVINDAYNASPESMKGAIDIVNRSKGRGVAVLGDMYELGEKSADLHQSVGRYAADSGLELLVTVGQLGEEIGNGAELQKKAGSGNSKTEVICYKNREEAEKELPSVLQKNDVVIVKASRTMELEHLAKLLADCGNEG